MDVSIPVQSESTKMGLACKPSDPTVSGGASANCAGSPPIAIAAKLALLMSLLASLSKIQRKNTPIYTDTILKIPVPKRSGSTRTLEL